MPTPVRSNVVWMNKDDYTYIGVDPGGKGGIAILQGSRVVTKPTPEFYCDQLLWLHRKLEEFPSPYRCVIEQVQGYIGSGGTKTEGGGFGNTGSSMFKFGQTYGAMLMALTALRDIAKLDLKYVTVAPNAWQRAMKIEPRKRRGPDKESKPKFKARLANIARSYFPQSNVTLLVSDALLIAKYCKEIYEW